MIKAITFDVFGTLLEYPADCPWIPRYAAEVRKIHIGDVSYRPLDVIFREIGANLGDLRPRDGVVESLAALAGQFQVSPLSNANSSLKLIKDICMQFNLPFNCFLDISRIPHYKPSFQFYFHAISQLGLSASEIVHVASHKFDLVGADLCGMRTAYLEWPDYAEENKSQSFTYNCRDISHFVKLVRNPPG